MIAIHQQRTAFPKPRRRRAVRDRTAYELHAPPESATDHSVRRGPVKIVSRAASASALLWLICMTSNPAYSADRNTNEDRNQSAEQPEDARGVRVLSRRPQGTVRMNFFNVSWTDVLKRVADDAGSKLILQGTPDGRYSRYDRRWYSRGEAVQILNRELEPQGFRILEQDDFLIVLDLHSVRSKYRRPAVSFESTSGRGGEHAAAQDTTPEPAPAPVQQPNRQTGVRRAARPANRSPRVLPVEYAQQANESEPEAVADQAGGQTVVATRRRQAVPLARKIYRAVQSRAESLDEGPEGLPAFRVFRSTTAPNDGIGTAEPRFDPWDPAVEELFTLGIDADRDELVVAAQPGQSDAVVKLIRRLDALDAGSRHDVQLVSATAQEQSVAQRLAPQLHRIAALQDRGRSDQRDEPRAEPGDAEAAPGNAADRAQEQPGPPSQEDLSTIIRGLKGDVSIEAMPDLGVLILSGNEQDVEAVRRVIGEIVRLSAGTTPDVHLLLLKHVNSESLAELLAAVYSQLGTMRFGAAQQTQRVTAIPVVVPNAVLILAPPADMQSILKLADELDRPVDPNTQFQVIRLKNAVASQVVAILNDLGDEPRGLGARVSAVADLRTNSVIVQASPRDLAEVVAVVRKIDRDGSGSVSRMRIFPLTNAVADEMAAVISLAIQSVLNPQAITRGFPGATGGPAGQQQGPQPGSGTPGAQQLQEAKSVVLEFLTTDGETERTVRSGILADIRVTSDIRTNSLVVTAPEQSMQLMEALIRQLDQPTAAVADIKVFTLKNADAETLVEILQALFEPPDQQQPGGLQVVGAEDAGSNLIPVRFSVDPRTNSVIAFGSADVMNVVAAILYRLDESDIRQARTEVIRLKNSFAGDVAQAINEYLTSQRDLANIDPELISNIELLEREIIVVPELATNSLLISATPRYFDQVREIIRALDEAPAQVIIQAMLIEVELDNTDEFGVELGLQDSILFGRSLIDNILTLTQTSTSPSGVTQTAETLISQESVPGFLFNRPDLPLGNNTTVNPSSVGSQGLTNFSLNGVNNDLGFGGLVLSASSESISILIRALAARRTVQILSRPQIQTLDNQRATILVGQQVPVVDGVAINLGVVSPTIRRDDAGIILTVIPRITPDGEIVMQTIAEKSQYSGAGEPIFTDAATGNTIFAPTKDITVAEATVSVPNGQTIVLGGMITKADTTLERKVPWLGDLPLLGHAFRYDATTTRRTELLIFLTPRIIHNDADLELIKQIEAERLHFLEEDAEMLHGPLFAVPPGEPAGSPEVLYDEHPLQPEPGMYPPAPDGINPPQPQTFPPPAASGFLVPDDADVPTTIMSGASLPIERGQSLQSATIQKAGAELKRTDRAAAPAANPSRSSRASWPLLKPFDSHQSRN